MARKKAKKKAVKKEAPKKKRKEEKNQEEKINTWQLHAVRKPSLLMH